MKIKEQVHFLLCVCFIIFSSAPLADAANIRIRNGSSRSWNNPNTLIVQIAGKYNGVPYKYGGSTPKGFDCSGFTSHVLKEAGVEIPRTAREQYGTGSFVSRSDLKKGDLVFFTRRPSGRLSTPNHVAIYIGNGKFIHASSAEGKVRCDELNNLYWQKRYKGARRLTGV